MLETLPAAADTATALWASIRRSMPWDLLARLRTAAGDQVTSVELMRAWRWN